MFGIQSTVCNIALDDPDKVDTKTCWSSNKAVLHPTSVPGALTSLESTAAHRLSNALSSYNNINCKNTVIYCCLLDLSLMKVMWANISSIKECFSVL